MHPGTPHPAPSPARPRGPARRPLLRLLQPPRTLCSLCDLCVSTPLVQLRPHPPRFHTLAHSFAHVEKSPQCFHTLTNPFSRNYFPLIFLQKPRGCGGTAITGSFVPSAFICVHRRHFTGGNAVIAGNFVPLSTFDCRLWTSTWCLMPPSLAPSSYRRHLAGLRRRCAARRDPLVCYHLRAPQ